MIKSAVLGGLRPGQNEIVYKGPNFVGVCIMSAFGGGSTSSKKFGSYGWWRENYKTDHEYQKVLATLSQYGWDTSDTEVDHFPPASAYRSYHTRVDYNDMPAFPLIKALHQPQRGEAYGGGYATSSKSSGLAKHYQKMMRSKLEQDQSGSTAGYAEAMWQDLNDKRNLALVATSGHANLSIQHKLFDPLLERAVSLAYHSSFISRNEAERLLGLLYDLPGY